MDDPDRPIADEEGFLPGDAPPAWGTESRRARLERLLRKARGLPVSAGVYLMKDASGVVLYVGKASRLPDRVGSYFVPSADLGPGKQAMLDLVHDFDVLPCASEWEALLTESRLIKDIKPRFNVLQTDDKTYPYLAITRDEDFPRVLITRNPSDPSLRRAKVYGPFVGAGALREAMAVAQRIFRFRTCSLDIVEGDPKNRHFRPCLLAAIGQCSAPCADRISGEDYRADIDRLVRFVESRRSSLVRELRREMARLSEAREYERAAVVRDQIEALEKLDERASMRDGWQPETEIAWLDPARSLRSLARTLGLEETPRCIEGFDIAHLMGDETVASKVCFVDGRPFKDEYRRYRIRTAGNDDFAAMREVISRRYRDAGRGFELFPHVILIDGGRGQLNAAMEAFETLDARPAMVVALAKKEEELYLPDRSEPLRLSRRHLGLRLLQQVRDEAHRFAQHYHHILRRKKTMGEG